MNINELLYKLDSVYNSGALDRSVRDAAQHAYQFIIAFKCARHLDGDDPADGLRHIAWDCQTDESSKEDAVPAHKNTI